MKIVAMQCFGCKFNVRWNVTEENFPGIYECDQYKKIPSFVEDGTKQCPKFEEQ